MGDVADVFDGPHATPTKIEHGPWYLSISSLNHGSVDLSSSAHISNEDFEKWTRRVEVRRGDTLFSYETRLGSAGHWALDVPAALGRRMGILRPKPDVIDPRFLTYAYLGPDFQEQIRRRANYGATVDRIPIAELPSWEIALPPIDEQRRIAGVLGTLDDLADLEDAQSELASQLAQALVARSQNPVPLGEFAQEHRASCKPEGITDHYSLPAFDQGVLPERVLGSQIKSSKNLLTNHCVLVSRLNPHIPRVWMAYPDPDVTSVASTEFVAIEADGVEIEWLWAATSASPYLAQMQGRVTGTTGSHQRVDKSTLMQLSIPSPLDASPSDRDAVVTLVREAAACRKESARIRRTRNELLPLLMSGRVRVGEVDGVGSV